MDGLAARNGGDLVGAERPAARVAVVHLVRAWSQNRHLVVVADLPRRAQPPVEEVLRATHLAFCGTSSSCAGNNCALDCSCECGLALAAVRVNSCFQFLDAEILY